MTPLAAQLADELARWERAGLRRELNLPAGVDIAPSGDIFIAFSTANRDSASELESPNGLEMLTNRDLNRLFAATVQATEEAVINALVAAETMTGANDVTVFALPHDRLRDVLRKYNRLVN